ncbi:DUF2306 domain-containing protein [Chitinophaga silvisoli]|uniref:DUF2306 domain-containing protein n=1 Tax=Chitinophaga silvisoli TaxID=2291814 RepID=A0A3E1NSJ7_9BACT|nr:DUF2306 domain-containing protein [Chitinophaga silvisoli]RFM30906.1 DUF2306 domain-containing protein [Chitinophaga silvisoli]
MKIWLFVIICILAILIGAYPLIYVFVDHKNTFLHSKSPEILGHIVYKTAFFAHITFGGISLFIGWRQFGDKFRSKYLNLHKIIGKVYVVCVTISSLCGIYIGFYANGNSISAIGFICLGLTWFLTTVIAVIQIRKGKVINHQQLMTYSFACTFAAVTLRLWYPLLIQITKDPASSYLTVAWLCWIPNLFVAALINKANFSR